MPIINRQDAAEVEQDVARFFAAAGVGRVQALRRLFVEKLDFNSAAGSVSLANAPKNVALPPSAERIASMEGLHVVYVPLSGNGPGRIRKAEATAAAKLIADALHGDLLLVMTNPLCSQLHFIYPSFIGSTPSLRRMIIERDLPRRTAVQQLSNIFWQWKDTGTISLAVDKAFDVDAVTKQFFEEYKRVFENVLATVKGFGSGKQEDEAKKLFVQTLFNRLMFIYFLSRKGWLKFNGNPDYLNALRQSYPTQSEDKNLYNSRLKPLFFAGLNRDVRPRTLASLIGDVPFLNGGLFEETPDDKRTNIVVPDTAIDQILRNLFDRYNFTVMESTPFDTEVAIDPEMLGKVFEELVTGRHESGSYYTPRPVVSFMCREALKGYLESQNTGASTEAIAAFVDHKDTSEITISSAPRVGEALSRVKVVDPACGSGAYLLGMMQELVELMAALYSTQLSHQAQDVYNLKLGIIQQNLYGADIDQFAVNIAMLRLWLSLAIEYDGPVPLPLPNLDFKIVCGDSLTAPDPNPSVHGAQYQMFREQLHAASGRLAKLKHQHMNAVDPEKRIRADDIQKELANLRAALAFAPAPMDAVDWRVTFAEVFDQNGGFDIAIANPPYVNMVEMDSRNSTYRTILRALFTSAKGGFDLYIPFMERGLQMLKTEGMFAFIVPNKVLSSEYAREIRSLFVKAAPPTTLVDMSSVHIFEASVYPVVIVATKASPEVSRHTLGAWRASGDSAERVRIEFVGTAPLSLVAAKGETWSPLLVSSPKAVFLTHSKRFPALVTMASIHGACTVSEAYEWKDAIRNDGKDLARNPKRYAPFIVSGNIRPFRHTWDTERVRYIKDTYSHPVIDKSHRAISSTRRLQIESAKVIISGMSKRPTSVWDRGGIAAGKSTVIVIPNHGLDGRYLTCVINSEVMHELYMSLFGSLSLAGGYLRFGPPQIRVLPIGIPSDGILARICDLADELVGLINNLADPGRHDAELAITEEIDDLVRGIYA